MGRGLRLRLGGRLGCEALCSPPQSGAALPQTCPQEFSQAQCPAPPFIPRVRIRKSPGPSLSGLCRAGSTLRVRVSLNCVP